MKYQLVLQFPTKWPWTFNSLVRLEDQLIKLLGDSALIDGHDCGSGEMNIFIHTDDPFLTFQAITPHLTKKRWLPSVTAAYRLLSGDDYTVVWPKNSDKPFHVT